MTNKLFGQNLQKKSLKQKKWSSSSSSIFTYKFFGKKNQKQKKMNITIELYIIELV